jgi:AMME syndrome candidate gene 1 protein
MSLSSGGDIEATPAMCAYCFDTLTSHFQNVDVKQLPLCTPLFDITDSVRVGGMFVTLNIMNSSEQKQLRGCIGRLSELSLNEMANYVLLSAFKDSRFPPLTVQELPRLEVAISLLVKYEPADNCLDWEVISLFWTLLFSFQC